METTLQRSKPVTDFMWQETFGWHYLPRLRGQLTCTWCIEYTEGWKVMGADRNGLLKCMAGPFDSLEAAQAAYMMVVI